MCVSPAVLLPPPPGKRIGVAAPPGTARGVIAGTGVKAYFLAGPAFCSTAKNDARGVELYAGRRFFAVTGASLGELAPERASITHRSRDPPWATNSRAPLELTLKEVGPLPTGIVRVTLLSLVRMTETFEESTLATYAKAPFGLIATAIGPSPTGMVLTSMFVVASRTETGPRGRVCALWGGARGGDGCTQFAAARNHRGSGCAASCTRAR